MKATLVIFLFAIFKSMTCFSQIQVEMNDEQRYGQKPPGVIPEIYKPMFNFLEGIEYNDLVFSPSGMEVCYSIRDTSAKLSNIHYLKKENGNWAKPELAYFIPNSSTGDLPQFSPDGKRFTYTSNGDFWSCTKKNNKWTIAEKMPSPVCTKEYECGFSFAKSGSVYFASNGRPEGKGQCDIYCSTLTNNQFETPQNIANLNTDASECVVTVSPNEKYIVFTRFLIKDGQNATDLYISFRKQNGDWTLAQKLGPLINSSGANNNPVFSSDGKYFFFCQIFRTTSGNYEINRYWVNTLMFDDLRVSSLVPTKDVKLD